MSVEDSVENIISCFGYFGALLMHSSTYTPAHYYRFPTVKLHPTNW